MDPEESPGATQPPDPEDESVRMRCRRFACGLRVWGCWAIGFGVLQVTLRLGFGLPRAGETLMPGFFAGLIAWFAAQNVEKGSFVRGATYLLGGWCLFEGLQLAAALWFLWPTAMAHHSVPLAGAVLVGSVVVLLAGLPAARVAPRRPPLARSPRQIAWHRAAAIVIWTVSVVILVGAIVFLVGRWSSGTLSSSMLRFATTGLIGAVGFAFLAGEVWRGSGINTAVGILMPTCLAAGTVLGLMAATGQYRGLEAILAYAAGIACLIAIFALGGAGLAGEGRSGPTVKGT